MSITIVKKREENPEEAVHTAHAKADLPLERRRQVLKALDFLDQRIHTTGLPQKLVELIAIALRQGTERQSRVLQAIPLSPPHPNRPAAVAVSFIHRG